MGKFSSAKMNGAQDVKFKNVYNSLIDLLETGYVVESMIGGHRIRVTIDTENGFLITKDGVKILGLDVTSGNITLTGTASEEEVENLDNLISALDDAAVKLGVTYAGAAMSALSGFTSTAMLEGKQIVINMSAAGGGLTISADGVQIGGICLVGGVPALIAGVLSNSSNPNVWAEIGEKVIDGNALKGLLMYRLDSLGAKYAASGWTLDADDGFAIGDSTYERFFAHGDNTGMRHSNGQALIQVVNNKLRLYNPDGTDYITGAVTIGTITVEFLVVAGGGGGGKYIGGGGGGGGVLYCSSKTIASDVYLVEVGAGGLGGGKGVSTNRGNSGGNSSFNTAVAIGGGGGGGYPGYTKPADGGSGGGGMSLANDPSGIGGVSTQTSSGGAEPHGYAGGDGLSYEGGGGGGAGGKGQSVSETGYAGRGGLGYISAISGAGSIEYAGGGGGGGYAAVGGIASGGGGGGGYQGEGYTATPNTGGGGGGGGAVDFRGGDGGSGIVIIRYLTANAGACTGGTITVAGSYTIHTFTSSGEFTAVAK